MQQSEKNKLVSWLEFLLGIIYPAVILLPLCIFLICGQILFVGGEVFLGGGFDFLKGELPLLAWTHLGFNHPILGLTEPWIGIAAIASLCILFKMGPAVVGKQPRLKWFVTIFGVLGIALAVQIFLFLYTGRGPHSGIISYIFLASLGIFPSMLTIKYLFLMFYERHQK